MLNANPLQGTIKEENKNKKPGEMILRRRDSSWVGASRDLPPSRISQSMALSLEAFWASERTQISQSGAKVTKEGIHLAQFFAAGHSKVGLHLLPPG